MIDRLRRDPGLALVLLALALIVALYASTLGRGLVNYDDPWLVRDNFLLQHPSWSSLRAILFDTSGDTRFALGAEYLPVRDLSIMLDHAIWGSWYGGYHLTNVVVYLATIVVWFRTLERLGIDRKVAGLMILLWAVHPSHAESVAWVTERKGLLGCLFAGIAGLGYARFRTGDSARWLALATAASVLAVWSKAPAAFAIAALAGLELVVPAPRRSWRRSAVGLATIGVVGALAFIPVVIVATSSSVVGTEDHAPGGPIAMALGLHGFYVRMAAMAVKNAVSYPISTNGPEMLDLVIGSFALAVALAVSITPARGWWRPPLELRVAAVLWLFGWLPISRLVLPLRSVIVADRYMLLPTLGVALAGAFALSRIAHATSRNALIAVIVLAASIRTLDAQANWCNATSLWERAVSSNPDDGEAWSMYAEALLDAGDPMGAAQAVQQGLSHSRSPRLLLRDALITLQRGDRDRGVAAMQDAAVAGEPRAMSNLALLLLDDGKLDDALAWASRGAAAMPLYAPGHRTHGKIALAAHHLDQAFDAFTRAYQLEPNNLANRFNLALVLIELGRRDEARVQLEACVRDPSLGARARAALAELGR